MNPIHPIHSMSAVSASAPSNVAAAANTSLDKNAFLKLLVTQLQNQDPTHPMEDKEFIAQMAQFSSLEQMTNISTGVGNLSKSQGTTAALLMAGRTVDLLDPSTGAKVSGTVDEV